MSKENLKFYELSHPEKRLFYMQKYYPETAMWNVSQSVIFNSPIDFNILKQAMGLFIKNNQNMRIRFTENEAGPRQYIQPYSAADGEFEMIEFKGPGAADKMHE